MEITEFPLSVLDMVQRTDIEEYLDYMSLYQKDGKNITNEERGKARKLAALRSFYNYYFQSERIEKTQRHWFLCRSVMKKRSSVWNPMRWLFC